MKRRKRRKKYELAIVTETKAFGFNKIVHDIKDALDPWVKSTIYDWSAKKIPEEKLLFFGSIVGLTLKHCARFLPEKDIIIYGTVEGTPFLEKDDVEISKDFRIVAVSNYVKRKLEDAGLEVEGVVYHGVPVKPVVDKRYLDYLRGLFKKADPLCFACSTNDPRKGLDKLLLAWRLVERELPKAILLLHSGSGVVDIIRLKNSLEIERLHFTNSGGTLLQSKVQAMYALSNFLVTPSMSEGFGMIMTEAAVHSKPSVALDSPPFNEIIRNERTGVLFPYDHVEYYNHLDRLQYELKVYSADSLADAILHMVPLAKELGRNARRDVRLRFNSAKLYPQLLEFFSGGKAEVKRRGKTTVEEL